MSRRLRWVGETNKQLLCRRGTSRKSKDKWIRELWWTWRPCLTKLPLQLCHSTLTSPLFHSATLLPRHFVTPPATAVSAIMLGVPAILAPRKLENWLPSNTGEILALKAKFCFYSGMNQSRVWGKPLTFRLLWPADLIWIETTSSRCLAMNKILFW